MLLSVGAALAGVLGGAVFVLAQAPALDEESPDAAPDASETAADVSPDPPVTTPKSSPPTPEPSLPPQPSSAAPFEAHPDDVYRNAKQVAGRVVQHLTTYPTGSAPRDVAATVVSEFGGDMDTLAAAAAGLVNPTAASSGRVVYPQLGGVTPNAASVMVLVRQETIDAEGRSATVTRTLDVRLRLEGDRWAFDHLASDGGPAESRPGDLSPAAVAVLDHPGIDLPDSARWDIYRGDIDDGLLALMADLAERHHIGVLVLSTGHPWEVFASGRQSNHTKGRAVDIYAVDGEPVIAQRAEDTPAYELSRSLFDQGVPELGSPWAFDGFGGRSFTDVVHQDHVHVAVTTAA